MIATSTTSSTTSSQSVRRNPLPGTDDVTRAELPNGIIVLARENFNTPAVVIAGTLHAGSIYEPNGREGLANFVAASLMRGTKRRDFNTLHGTLEDLGASLGVGGGVHTAGFSGKSLAEDLPTLLSLLSEVLREPGFPRDQVERLRNEYLTGLKIQAMDTRSVAGELFRANAYPEGHPYRRSADGTLETLPTITLEEMATWHAQQFGPRQMIVIVVGAIKPEEAIRQVADALGGWQNPEQPAIPAMPSAAKLTEIKRSFKALPGKVQTDILLGYPGPHRLAEDFHAANLGNSILGEFGMMGRLGKSIREDQGLAYYAGSGIGAGLGPSPWRVSAGVDPSNVETAISSIVAEIRRFTDERVTEDELADVKANYIGRLPLSLESNGGVAGALLNMETYGLGLDYLRNYRTVIEAVTVEQVNVAARHYLSPDAYALGISGPG